MGNTFRVAADPSYKLPPKAKQPKPEEITNAKHVISKARSHEVKLLLPVDDVDGFDIGPKTTELFCKELTTAKTVFWNGPLGMFEKPEYADGTFSVARALAASHAVKIVGGGDTAAAVHAAGVADRIDHISTGGGATLEFLEGNSLPGIDILESFGRHGTEMTA
jgi:phosphoglycerate kinase